jgi:hypothetical protein
MRHAHKQIQKPREFTNHVMYIYIYIYILPVGYVFMYIYIVNLTIRKVLTYIDLEFAQAASVD